MTNMETLTAGASLVLQLVHYTTSSSLAFRKNTRNLQSSTRNRRGRAQIAFCRRPKSLIRPSGPKSDDHVLNCQRLRGCPKQSGLCDGAASIDLHNLPASDLKKKLLLRRKLYLRFLTRPFKLTYDAIGCPSTFGLLPSVAIQ